VVRYDRGGAQRRSADYGQILMQFVKILDLLVESLISCSQRTEKSLPGETVLATARAI
jgi:hypothetical protein